MPEAVESIVTLHGFIISTSMMDSALIESTVAVYLTL